MFELMDSFTQNAVIKVIGVGGGGGNAVQHMVTQNIEGVDFIIANTDDFDHRVLCSRFYESRNTITQA